MILAIGIRFCPLGFDFVHWDSILSIEIRFCPLGFDFVHWDSLISLQSLYLSQLFIAIRITICIFSMMMDFKRENSSNFEDRIDSVQNFRLSLIGIRFCPLGFADFFTITLSLTIIHCNTHNHMYFSMMMDFSRDNSSNFEDRIDSVQNFRLSLIGIRFLS